MGVVNQTPYDGGSFVPGTLSNSQLCFRHDVTRKLTLPTGAINSGASARVAAAGSAVFSIQVNGSQVGTITFSSNTTGVFSVTTDVSMNPGDTLSVVGPNPADGNLADLSITFGLQRR